MTIPSQRRYVEYFGHLLNTDLSYTPKQILFTGLLITYEQNHVLHSSSRLNRKERLLKDTSRISSSGLSYTVKSADHRIQYQSFEVPLERDTTTRRDLPLTYAVLHAAHKYFIPPNQECQITLEEDVLIEIFITKTRRGKPVRSESASARRIESSLLCRRNYAISGSIHSFSSNRKCKRS